MQGLLASLPLAQTIAVPSIRVVTPPVRRPIRPQGPPAEPRLRPSTEAHFQRWLDLCG